MPQFSIRLTQVQYDAGFILVRNGVLHHDTSALNIWFTLKVYGTTALG